MRTTRLAVSTLTVSALLLTAGCGTGSSHPPTPSSSSSASGTASPNRAVQVVSLTVKGGKVTGATGRVKVELGSTVRLVVTSDVSDEVHVHTYDKHADVTAGSTTTLQFTADIPAIIEVELETRRLLLTRLQVS